MLFYYHNEITFNCQYYRTENITNHPNPHCHTRVTSLRTARDFSCPHCHSRMYSYGAFSVLIKDFPDLPKRKKYIGFSGHRFRCTSCGETITEDIPCQCPFTRVTWDMALWIIHLLKCHTSISAISAMLSVHWSAIQKIQKHIMDKALAAFETCLKKSNYRPRYLAVDEFAIHKGHRYATCVMDLETGFILWAGLGRSMADFEHFFKSIDLSLLSRLKAVAMDMNASFNRLFQKYCPKVPIVYDRYHMQAQFGRDVMGAVRLEEAQKHRQEAEALKKYTKETNNPELQKMAREKSHEERKLYTELKKSRWILLKKDDHLNERQKTHLLDILSEHRDLAICYAMKQEMTRLFTLTDYEEALAGWTKWIQAGLESGIPALVKFARQKQKRIKGLAAHALYPINTGKLEGFNNKIKVLKRIGYGYRNMDYFFTLIRFHSLPKNYSSPKFP